MTKEKLKSIFNYISTVLTWTLFIVLLILGVILVWYFISVKVVYKITGKPPKYTVYTIVSRSMVPNINVYDMVINERIDNPKALKEGDIITFKSTCPSSLGLTVTHRIKKVYLIDGRYQYMTKGDNNFVDDEGPALYENVVGKVVYKLPYLGRLQFFVASKAGWLLIVVLPALIIIIKDIFKLVQITRMKKDAEKQNKSLQQISYAKEEYIPLKRMELLSMFKKFTEDIEGYEAFKIPNELYLDLLNKIENILVGRYFYNDKRFVTYGKISVLRNEFTLKIQGENTFYKGKWDNRLRAFFDLYDVVLGTRNILPTDIPEGLNYSDIVFENDNYYKEQTLCTEEVKFILSMVVEFKKYINEKINNNQGVN